MLWLTSWPSFLGPAVQSVLHQQRPKQLKCSTSLAPEKSALRLLQFSPTGRLGYTVRRYSFFGSNFLSKMNGNHWSNLIFLRYTKKGPPICLLVQFISLQRTQQTRLHERPCRFLCKRMLFRLRKKWNYLLKIMIDDYPTPFFVSLLLCVSHIGPGVAKTQSNHIYCMIRSPW